MKSLSFFLPQAHVLGAMAVASDDAPDAAADFDLVAISHAPIRVRHFRDGFAEAAEAHFVTIERVFVPAGGAIETHALFRRFAACVGDEHAAGDVFKPAHPEGRVELAADPTGEPHVVGMHVRADHALDRLAVQSRIEDRAPIFARLFERDAGIDDGPAVAIGDQPQIDPLQRERQRHAYPEHARRNLARLARGRWIAQRIDEVWAPTSLGDRFVIYAVHRHVLDYLRFPQPSRGCPPNKWAPPQKSAPFRLPLDAKALYLCGA
jgi:hypothetical protein